MKYWIILVSALLIFSICESPTIPNTLESTHAAWVKCIPDWDLHDIKTQETILRLYELSPNKHNWFPDSFPNPHQGVFIIYPR